MDSPCVAWLNQSYYSLYSVINLIRYEKAFSPVPDIFIKVSMIFILLFLQILMTALQKSMFYIYFYTFFAITNNLYPKVGHIPINVQKTSSATDNICFAFINLRVFL